MKITKESIIKDVISSYPNVAKILMKNNIHCLTCPVTASETINEAAAKNKVDITTLMNEIDTIMKED